MEVTVFFTFLLFYFFTLLLFYFFTLLLFYLFFLLYLGLGLAETALTGLVADDGLVKVFLVEVGPVGVAEIELRVSALPEQVIGDANLATSTDQKIGIGHPVRPQVLGNALFGDIVDAHLTILHLTGQDLGGVDELLLR